MKKEKRKNMKKANKICMITLSTLGSVIFILIFFMMFGDFFAQKTYAKEVDSKGVVSQKTYISSMNSPIDVQAIIQKNIEDTITEQLEKQEVDLEYMTRYIQNSNIPKGTLQVTQDGINGKQNIVTKKSYQQEKLIKEEVMGNQVIKSSVDKIVQVGTGMGSKYVAKKGDTAVVTSMILPIRMEANENAEKVTTIHQGEKVFIREVLGQWCNISYKTYSGYAKTDCLTYDNPNIEDKNQDHSSTTAENTKTKQQLLNTLSFDMKLNKPSGLSLEQFKSIFQHDSHDKNMVFQENAEYFYYIEQQYQVNGVFVAAVGIHESSWGTSAMAKNKKNLFGYGAYDRNPSDNAYSFNTYAEGIDLLGRVFVKYYLNPKGTSIYEGGVAEGSHYKGATLSGVNTKYASDKNWSNAVYGWMKYLYQKIG